MPARRWSKVMLALFAVGVLTGRSSASSSGCCGRSSWRVLATCSGSASPPRVSPSSSRRSSLRSTSTAGTACLRGSPCAAAGAVRADGAGNRAVGRGDRRAAAGRDRRLGRPRSRRHATNEAGRHRRTRPDHLRRTRGERRALCLSGDGGDRDAAGAAGCGVPPGPLRPGSHPRRDRPQPAPHRS